MYKSIFRGVIKIQNTNFAKDSVKSITAVIITVLWYGMERVVEVFMTLSKSQSIALACISTYFGNKISVCRYACVYGCV